MCSHTRYFQTKDERIEMLKEYKESLEKEAQGVSEKIEQMKKAA